MISRCRHERDKPGFFAARFLTLPDDIFNRQFSFNRTPKSPFIKVEEKGGKRLLSNG